MQRWGLGLLRVQGLRAAVEIKVVDREWRDLSLKEEGDT